MPLQRVMTDFGSERSFAKAARAVKEHHGIIIPETAQRFFTLKHAKRIPTEAVVRTLPSDGTAKHIIAETDGSFVPIIAFKPGYGDKRKRRFKEHKEVRLCAAQAQGNTTNHYSNGGFGDVERTGNAMAQSALRAGWSSRSDVHCVGDGAPWIVNQVEKQFGKNRYLLDFYHLCQYLQPAAQSCCIDNPQQWLKSKRELLKQNKPQEVLDALSPHIEEQALPDEIAPVRCAHRYIGNRLEQLDYKTAIAKELPIGSGIIESAHGHVIQDRIKKSGAAWELKNADAMISLRVLRANHISQWENFWKN